MSRKSIKTLLLVEDNPGDARLFREAFKQQDSHDTELTHVESMMQAEKHLAEHAVDIILLDLGLPDARGLEAVRRAHAAAPRVPLVVLTSLDDEFVAAEALQEGAQDYLIKGQIETRGLLRALRHSVERKIMDDALFGEKERAQVTLNSIGDAVVCTDIAGNVTFLNLVAEKMTGWSRHEAAGRSMAEVCRILDATTRKVTPNPMERAVGHNRTEHLPSNCVLIRLDGFEIPIEDSVAPIHDSQGQATGAVIVFRDITERKRREDDLSRLAAIVGSSYDAIISLTPQGVILTWNHGAERIFGYSAKEAMGQSILILSPPDRPVMDPTLLEMVERAHAVENFHTVHVKKDGTQIQVALTLSPIKDSAGHVLGVSSVARDITESKHLEEMFRQAQKMEAVGQLAGGVAHDFNNLLGVILGYSELLLERAGLNDLQRKDIEEIQNAGVRAALLTRQLLAFSRKEVLQPKVLDLNSVVTGAEKLLHRLIGEDIEVVVVLDPALERVKADPGQLEQIIMNLAVNARDAMPAGGKITIETSNVELDETYSAEHPSTRAGPHVMLAVTDTGCGMDEKTKAHIFEPFFTTKELGKGTGLGLSTVYGIVKQSGGSVWVYTEPEIGTTFKIYLPRVDQASEAGPRIDKAEREDRGSQTILIVEDDAALLQVTHRSLEEVGYAILVAQSAAEAIHISESHAGPIHLMVTDVIMPKITGPQLASHLFPLRPEMKVLYVSGYTDNAIVQHGVLEPGLAFLQKPFSPRTLARKVGEVLAPTLTFGPHVTLKK